MTESFPFTILGVPSEIFHRRHTQKPNKWLTTVYKSINPEQTKRNGVCSREERIHKCLGDLLCVCVCVWSALRQACLMWISDRVSFHVHTNAAGAHTRASLRLWRQQMRSSDGGQVCSTSLSLCLSLSVPGQVTVKVSVPVMEMDSSVCCRGDGPDTLSG